MPSPTSGPLLAIDSGSPLISVAAGWPGRLLAVGESRTSRSSTALMRLIDDCLHEAEVRPAGLGGVVVLSGPGSFTGLRVGMSVAMGFRQAVGIAAGTVSTFLALASRAPDPERPVLAAVQALRSEWYVQAFHRRSEPPAAPDRQNDSQLLAVVDSQIVGFGLDGLMERSSRRPEARWTTPGALAETALELADVADWRPPAVSTPTYLAPPPAQHRPVPGASG